MKRLNTKTTIYYLLAAGLITYIIIKSLTGLDDLENILYASNQLLNGEDIYSNNPYARYLYSPFYALLITPLAILPTKIAYLIWSILNTFLAWRLWIIFRNGIKEHLNLSNPLQFWWTTCVIILSLGFLNHNLILGQITIVILWLTLEGLNLILNKKREFAGAALVALGISIKIVPIIALYYLTIKGKFRSVAITLAFVFVAMAAPSIFIGIDYNLQLLGRWKETINPTQSRYVFEDNPGTHSLNAILPAYFYEFENNANEQFSNFRRTIIAIPQDSLVVILNLMRLILVLSVLFLVFYKYKRRENSFLYFYWEVGFLMLVSYLIFPHQQKYVMLYFVPAGSYMLLYILPPLMPKYKGKPPSLKQKIIGTAASILIIALSIMGRDIIGNYLANLLDYYHLMGIITFIFLIFLILVRPDEVIDLLKQ